MTINIPFPCRQPQPCRIKHIKNSLYNESDSVIDYIARSYGNMEKGKGNSTWEFMEDFTEEQILGEKSPSREGKGCAAD